MKNKQQLIIEALLLWANTEARTFGSKKITPHELIAKIEQFKKDFE